MLIGEVSRQTGVSSRMLRHYDRIGLVQPTVRTSGGYREYSPADLCRLFHVESLRTLGLSLAEVGRALDDADFAPGELVADLITHTRRRIAAEQELLTNLERVDAAGPAGWDDVLNIVAMVAALESSAAGRRQQAALAVDPASTLPVDALVEALLTESDRNVAGALQWALAREPDRALVALAVGLESPDVEVRRRALIAIDDIGADDAADLLAGAVGDADRDIVDRAALGLGRRGRSAAIPALVTMIVTGERDVEAAEVLGALDDSDACRAVTDELRRALASAEQPVRLRIAQALAEIPGPAATAMLAELSHDADRVVRVTAAAIRASRAT